ncbi:hypothetical protein [Streptomyces sp. NPDC017991]|uniref:hypothetical protein n=1 Tax=Streptomyces sp. NPDC017991 TaxID=3365026 RepID=UPI0037AB6EE2
MRRNGARVLVAGATGVLGGALIGRDQARGAAAVGDEVAASTGVVAEHPQAGLADYRASKAAPSLSAWLGAVRREVRTAGVPVLEVRPGQLDTGCADRVVMCTAPPSPAAGDPRDAVKAVADAMAADAELLRTAPDGTPLIERRAR